MSHIKKIGKQFIADELYERGVAGLVTKASCEFVVEEVINIIYKSLLKGERINLPPIGIIFTKEMSAHPARNPKTGIAMTVPAQIKVKFQTSKQMKEDLEKVKSGVKVESFTY